MPRRNRRSDADRPDYGDRSSTRKTHKGTLYALYGPTGYVGTATYEDAVLLAEQHGLTIRPAR